MKNEDIMSPPPHHQKVPLPPIKWYKKLATKKGRIEAGAFLIEGPRSISQITSGFPQEIIEIVISDDHLATPYVNYPCRIVTETQFNSIANTKTPQGIIAVVRLPADIYSDELPRDIGSKVLLLEDVQDPGNVGTIIRTAAAFGFNGIILSEKCADPVSPKCVQSTAGAVMSIWIRRTSDYLCLAESLKEQGHRLVVADINGSERPTILNRKGDLVLALGNESIGPSESLLNLADNIVCVPIDNQKVESLNVAVCGAVCMYLSSMQ